MSTTTILSPCDPDYWPIDEMVHSLRVLPPDAVWHRLARYAYQGHAIHDCAAYRALNDALGAWGQDYPCAALAWHYYPEGCTCPEPLPEEVAAQCVWHRVAAGIEEVE